MTIASASYVFNPSVGTAITVTNKANETEVKAAVLAELAVRKAAGQTTVNNAQAAEDAMNG